MWEMFYRYLHQVIPWLTAKGTSKNKLQWSFIQMMAINP